MSDLRPSQQIHTLGPGRHHRIPHAMDNVFVQVYDRDGRTPMWDVGSNGCGIGPIVGKNRDEVFIDLPGEGEGLTAVIVGLPRALMDAT